MSFAATVLTLYRAIFPVSCSSSLTGFATDGHYPRPDVFEHNMRAKDGVSWKTWNE